MNHYKDLMNRVAVSDEMEARILRHLKDNPETDAVRLPHRHRSYLLPAAAGLVLCISISAAAWLHQNPSIGQPSRPERPPVMVTNSIETTETLEALSALVGFDVVPPEGLICDTDSAEYRSVQETLAEVLFRKGTQTAVFRQTRGEEDPSGDYTAYAAEETIDIPDGICTLKGEAADAYRLAVWTDGTFSYSLRLTKGRSAADWIRLLFPDSYTE